jgi:ribosomal protein S12 methylthiotransferase
MRTRDKISVITLGCSKNTVDSERLLNQLKANDLNISDDLENTDTVIINTCGFIEAAKEESINTILNAIALKQEGNILKELGGELKYNLLGERLISSPSHTAYLKISEGCDHPCSFCAIPLMRGKHVSRSVEELVNETHFLANNGTKEVVVIAQDTTDYGKDIYNQKNISYLLNKISEVEGIEWIRLMYAYPSKFPDDLIDVLANNPKVCKYIDIPLQHISNDVLRSMRRGVTARRTKELINKLRKNVAGIAIRTTFLIGYPNETEKDFKELCGFVEEFEFDRVGTFTFSVEENTSSFILGNPIPERVKLERKKILMKIQKEISSKKNKSLLGKKLNVLIDRVEGGFYIGRSYRDAPEVDGEVLIPLNGYKLKPGNFCIAKINNYNEYDLYGEIIHSGRI